MESVEIFKALSDETRIRILNILQNKTLCVCDIENILELSQVNASRHLSKLKTVKLINSEKKAQWVYFSINQEMVLKYSFLKTFFSENNYEEIFKNDLYFLEKYLKEKNENLNLCERRELK